MTYDHYLSKEIDTLGIIDEAIAEFTHSELIEQPSGTDMLINIILYMGWRQETMAEALDQAYESIQQVVHLSREKYRNQLSEFSAKDVYANEIGYRDMLDKCLKYTKASIVLSRIKEMVEEVKSKPIPQLPEGVE